MRQCGERAPPPIAIGLALLLRHGGLLGFIKSETAGDRIGASPPDGGGADRPPPQRSEYPAAARDIRCCPHAAPPAHRGLYRGLPLDQPRVATVKGTAGGSRN